MTEHQEERPSGRDRGVRLARWAIVSLLAILAVDWLLVLAGFHPAWLGALGLTLVAVLGVAVVAERRLVDRAATKSASTEATLTRMLRGLSRSVSADATVNAIVDELREASGADHVVIARLKPVERIVEATLVSSNAAVPLSVTRFPASDLEPAVGGRAGDLSTVGPRVMPVGPGIAGGVGPRAARHPAPLMTAAATAVTSGDIGARGRDRHGRAWADRPAVGGGTPGEVSVGDGSLGDSSLGGEPAPAEPLADPSGAPGAIRPGSAMYAVERIADRVCRAYGLRHILAEPLMADGRVVGALVLSRRTDSGWPAESRKVLESSAQDLSAALERAFAHEDARMRAATDSLTGIPNRAYFDELVELLGRGRRANDGLGILMLDLDRFKALNDRYGHVAGDGVLRAIGGVLRSTVRADDVPARYGGEEFVVVLRRATEETATEIAERIRRAVRSLDGAALGIDEPVTVSVGVAVGAAGAPALVERADAALYRAKRRGRDRVEVG